MATILTINKKMKELEPIAENQSMVIGIDPYVVQYIMRDKETGQVMSITTTLIQNDPAFGGDTISEYNI